MPLLRRRDCLLKMGQTLQVLLGDSVVGCDLCGVLESLSRLKVAAELQKGLSQAVQCIDVSRKEPQDLLIYLGGPIPIATEGQSDGLPALIPSELCLFFRKTLVYHRGTPRKGHAARVPNSTLL